MNVTDKFVGYIHLWNFSVYIQNMKKILVAVGTNIIEQVDRFPMGILWRGVWGEVCFRYKKHPMAVLASFFMKREKVVEGTVCQNAYSFHIELTELCTHSVLSTGTQDCRLPYTWRKNLSICTGISYNTSLNPIVQFCITLYSIIFPSCLANEIYFSRLCTSKTYPNLLKTVQTKK